jgi:uncharacterized protein (TIGR04255 family)
MPERFRNPPLIELVAELRWGSGGIGGVVATPTNPQTGGLVLVPIGRYEEFFMRFGQKAGAHGYDLVERILPPGFPASPFQTVYRFRRKSQEEGTTLYQVGAGVFTANITPPYRSWQEFTPVVETGIGLLLETRNPSETQMPFTSAILRYINSFNEKFTEGRSAATFIRDVLGFRIEPPTAIRSEIMPGAEAKPALQLTIPLSSGTQMTISLGEGAVVGAARQNIIMDIMVTGEAQIKPTVADVMAFFDSSHEIIQRAFVGTTGNLFSIMEPMSRE